MDYLHSNTFRDTCIGVSLPIKILLTMTASMSPFNTRIANTKIMKTRRLKGEDFIALIMQHILPKGFRRSRDYGFLHGNAKRWLMLIQWVLKVFIAPFNVTPRPAFTCKEV